MMVLVLGFTAWGLGLTWEVSGLRRDLAEQVGWQITLSSLEHQPGDGRAADTVRAILPAMAERLGSGSADAIRALEGAVAAGDPIAQRRTTAALIPHVRGSNATLSARLGNRWDQVTVLVFTALGFAFALLLLEVWREQDQDARQKSKRALRASEDRLARVGVALLVIDDQDQVSVSNEVARGLAQAHGSVEDWWKGVARSMRRPGTVPCQDCGRPMPLGRCEARDETRMGTRILEVVFGGHAHDLEHDDKLVLLVRDITDTRRRQVMGGIDDRLADTRDLVRVIARGLSAPATRLTRALRELQERAPDRAVEDALELATELRDFGSSLAILTQETKGACDVSTACDTAERLVRAQLAHNIVLVSQVKDGLRGHARSARLTQAVFTILLRAATACADGQPHRVTLRAGKAGAHIVIEVEDDRDPGGPGSKPPPPSITQEMFLVAGASFDRADADTHLAIIRVAALE